MPGYTCEKSSAKPIIEPWENVLSKSSARFSELKFTLLFYYYENVWIFQIVILTYFVLCLQFRCTCKLSSMWLILSMWFTVMVLYRSQMYVEYYEYPIFIFRDPLSMTFRKPINFSRDIINKRKEFLNNKMLRIRLNWNAFDSPVESKSPSSGLSGLLMLFLFDGECFKAVT